MLLLPDKKSSPKRAAFISYVNLRHPYVGMIQIRLSVEGLTFLSARLTDSRLLILSVFLAKSREKTFFLFLLFHKRTPDASGIHNINTAELDLRFLLNRKYLENLLIAHQ